MLHMLWFQGVTTLFMCKALAVLYLHQQFFIFSAPLSIESVSTIANTIYNLEGFNFNITVSGGDIDAYYLLWNPIFENGSLNFDTVGVSHYITSHTTSGNFRYGQKEAVLFSISPAAHYPIICNDSAYLNGMYTFLVEDKYSSSTNNLRRLFNFTVDISGKLTQL